VHDDREAWAMLKVVLDDYAGVARSPWQTGGRRLRRNSKIVILPAHDMPHVFSLGRSASDLPQLASD
jgi:hypothetical protein